MENRGNLIKELVNELEGLKCGDKIAISKFLSRAEMYLRNLGIAKPYYTRILNADLKSIYRPIIGESFEEAKKRVRGILEIALEEQMRFGTKGGKTEETETGYSNRVFLVHGHDEEMKLSVARTLEQLELEPIILHEQPDQGRAIIQKFEDYSDVGFAVILMSPDDEGRSKAESSGPKSRARQNVVLELGYFMGKIGRDRILVLVRETPDFEFPSDYHGVLYNAYDKFGNWQLVITRELKAAGYLVDANKLIKKKRL